MNSSIEDSIILIHSSNPDINEFGTGFVIYRDTQFTYIVTTGYVVKSVGGPNTTLADSVSTSILFIEDDIDVAILRVEGLTGKSPLQLVSTAKKEMKIIIPGYSRYRKQNLLRTLRGSLLDEVRIGGNLQKQITAWDIELLDDNQFLPGYGGSPVISEENDCVVGMVTSVQGRGKRGIAVSTSSLVSYLPQDIQNLVLPQLDVQSSTTTQAKDQTTPASSIEQDVRFAVAMNALSDSPSKVDLLEFTAYAEALTDFILNKDTEKPLRIVIDAPWGAGKTTLMQMIESELKERAKETRQQTPLIVKFNAWKYDQEASLWAAFVLKILQDVRKELPWQQRLGLWWRLNWKRMDWTQFFRGLATTLLVVVGFIFIGILLNIWTSIRQGDTMLMAFQHLYSTLAGGISALILIYTTAKAKQSSTTNPFSLKLAQYLREPNYQEKIGFIAQFEDDFKVVIDAVTKRGTGTRLLIIFIDDLDRCAPPKPVEIVESMNLLLDAENCVFVLGMDSRTVAASIEAKYDNLRKILNEIPASDGLTFGQRFLEKIVQITFRIPQTGDALVSSFIESKLRTEEKSSDGPATQSMSGVDPVKITSLIASWYQKVSQALNSHQTESGTPNESEGLVATGQLASENSVKQQQDRFAQNLNESPEVQDAIREVALYLEANPRKIKRFINIFRLQALIANRRKLLASGAINLKLLAKWMVLVTRWPSIFDSVLIDKSFVHRLKEAHSLKKTIQSYQSDNDVTPLNRKEQNQARFDAILEDIQIKRLITAADLSILRDIKYEEVKDLSTYLYLTQPVVASGIAVTAPAGEKSDGMTAATPTKKESDQE